MSESDNSTESQSPYQDLADAASSLEPSDFVVCANTLHHFEFDEGKIPAEPLPSTRHVPWLYESTGEGDWVVSFFGRAMWDSEGDTGTSAIDAMEGADELARNASIWLAENWRV